MPRWLWVLVSLFVALVLVAVSCGVGVILGAGLPRGLGIGDAVAIIRINGTIESGSGGGGILSAAGAYSDTIVSNLRKAATSRSVKAVVLRVDSPGGGVTPTDEIYNEIIKTKGEGKIIVASMGSLAASGGYYVCAAADRIVANKTTLTGSIGVISIAPSFDELLKKLGIRTQIFKSGIHKDESSGFRPLTEEEEKIWQSIIDDAYGRFVSVVAEGRKMEVGKVRELADGRLYTATQAQELGFIDGFGDLAEAIDLAAEMAGIEGKPRIVEYERRGLWASLLSYVLRPSPVLDMEELLGLKRQPTLQYLYTGP